jgi:hypothetical protein
MQAQTLPSGASRGRTGLTIGRRLTLALGTALGRRCRRWGNRVPRAVRPTSDAIAASGRRRQLSLPVSCRVTDLGHTRCPPAGW